MNLEDEINYLLKLFYLKQEEVEIWWNKPHQFLDDKPPKQLLLEGEGKKILDFLKLMNEHK